MDSFSWTQVSLLSYLKSFISGKETAEIRFGYHETRPSYRCMHKHTLGNESVEKQRLS